MRKITFILICCLLFLTARCLPSAGTRNVSFASPGKTVRVTGDYEDIPIRDFFLHNNVWGKEGIMAYRQEMFYTVSETDTNFGWLWDWPSTTRVVAFPEIIYGKSPWYPNSTTTNLPRPFIDEPITAEFAAGLSSSGKHNLAFDIWISRSIPCNIGNVAAEVMIWMVNKGFSPLGAYQGRFVIDGAAYDYYLEKNCTIGMPSGSRAYVAFFPAVNRTSGKAAIGKFLKFLNDRGDIPGSNYLTSIEFGTEIMAGSGSIVFSNYSVRFGTN